MKLPIRIAALLSEETYSLLSDFATFYNLNDIDHEVDFILVEARLAKEPNFIFPLIANTTTVLWYTDDSSDIGLDWDVVRKFDCVVLSEASSLKEYTSMLEPLGKKVGLVPYGFNPNLHNPTVTPEVTKGVLHSSPKISSIIDNQQLFNKFTNGSMLSFLAHELRVLADIDTLKYYPEYVEKFATSVGENEYRTSKVISFFEPSKNQTYISIDILNAIAEKKIVSVINNNSVFNLFGMLVYSGISQEETAYWLAALDENEIWVDRITSQAVRKVMQTYSSPALLNRLYSFATERELIGDKVAVISIVNTEQEVDYIINCFQNQKYNEKELIIIGPTNLEHYICNQSLCIKYFSDSSLLGKTVGQLTDSVFFALFDYKCAYGPYYLTDLMMARHFENRDGYLKSYSYEIEDGEIFKRSCKEYITINRVKLKSGIFNSHKFSSLTIQDLSCARIEGAFLVTDGQQFISERKLLSQEKLNHFLDTAESKFLPTLDEIMELNREKKTIASKDVFSEEYIFPVEIYNNDFDGNILIDINDRIMEFNVSSPNSPCYCCPNNYFSKEISIAPSQIPEMYRWVKEPFLSFSLEVKGDVIKGDVDASVMFVFYDHEKKIQQNQVFFNQPLVIQVPPSVTCGIPLIRIKGNGKCRITEIKVTGLPYAEVPLSWFDKSHADITVSPKSLGLSVNLDEGKHFYLRPESYRNNKFSLPPNRDLLPNLERGGFYALEIIGSVTSDLTVDLILLYYDKSRQIGRTSCSIGKKNLFYIEENVDTIAPVFRVSGKGKFEIHNIKIKTAAQMLDFERLQTSSEKVLLVTNTYPSENDYYANMFVHRRVVSYVEDNTSLCVFKTINQRNGDFNNYKFEGIDVFSGNTQDLKMFIKLFQPQKILVHFISKNMIEVFDEVAPDIPIIVWLHGAEVYPISKRLYNYQNYINASSDLLASLPRVDVVANMLVNKNYTFVTVSESLRRDIENDYGIELNTTVHPTIHNYIDGNFFYYVKKNAEQRKNIISVKSFRNRVYAGDILEKVVHHLSKREFFEDLSFTFYGQGSLFYKSLSSLIKYPNVRLINGFLNSEQLANLYRENGILLNPTRHDTHGVSRDEAMASGLVPISTSIACVPEFVDSNCGILTPAEDAEAMADAIELLYFDSDLFSELSLNAANRVRQQCGFDQTIKKEIELIKR